MTSGLFAGIQELVLADDPADKGFSCPLIMCTDEGVFCADDFELM